MINKLVILATSDNEDTLSKMAFLYGYNAKKMHWFDEVTFLLWGGVNEVVAKHKALQDQIKSALDIGVEVIACKYCADEMKVTETFESIGIKVFYTGEALTQYLKDDSVKVLTV